MVITFIYFLFCQLQINDTQFNLYNTDRSLMMNVFGYDCLYYDQDAMPSSSNSLIPYCIRPDTIKQSNDEDKLCYGEPITFKQLKTNNIKIIDLFEWNGVIEIIDLYEKYLLFPNRVDDNKLYCNCSLSTRFGKSCQYDINAEDYQPNYKFTDLVMYNGFVRWNEEMKNEYSTCYIGIQCQTNLICLDWRQICNGIVDCDYGEDEPDELCLQMEANECHPKDEFRCKNGFCIPIAWTSGSADACLDRSDALIISNDILSTDLLELCVTYPSSECDETNHGWKKFSCNNGQSISFSDVTSKVSKLYKTCANDHHLIYLRKLFNTNDQNECWKSMICLTGFDYLYSNINCLNENIQTNIQRYCPNEYYFPINSVVYSFIYFLYDKTNRIDSFNFTGPNYICYKKEFCQNDIFNLSTISKNNLTCFYVNQTSFSWKNFYEYIIYLFSSCFSSSIRINDKMFYKCNLSNSFISIYRVKDKTKDCFFNEDEDIDLCLFKTNDQFKCLTNQNQCIRQSLINDNEYDCVDGSDEYIQYRIYTPIDEISELRPLIESNFPGIYRFEELCDNIINRQLFSKESIETDETDCQYWPYTCYSNYTKCNRIWNCPNGSDELECKNRYTDQIQKALHCKSNEHYCIQLINTNNDINATCINTNRSGDGIIDCIGGTDERLTNICMEKYPTEFKRRFYCMNSSLCIRTDQVCDRISDCPFHDDELICPWLFQSNSSTFNCRNSPSHQVDRCDLLSINNPHCQMKENFWFCDLYPRRINMRTLSPFEFEVYPPIYQNIKSISFERSNLNKLLTAEKQTLSLIDNNPDLSLCNLGYLIKSLTTNNKSYCFCPPSYYGDYCQYQSERLTVLLNIQTRYYMNPSTVFRLIIYLLNENYVILSYDEIVFTYDDSYVQNIYLIYLMSERTTNVSLHERSKSKSVRIDSYMIKQTNIHYISSWFFHVSFPFLPVNRLVVHLLLVNESFTAMYCKKRCGSHGKCMHYVNLKEREYCWCDQGWFGENCQTRSSLNLSNATPCSPHSQYVILNEEKKQIKCICSLGKSGDQCYITHNACYSNPCQNNGTCLPLDERNLGYKCVCTDNYSGPYCKEFNKDLYISIDNNITDLSLIPAIIVSVSGLLGNTFEQRFRILFTDITLPTILKLTKTPDQFGFVRMFHNLSKSSYYLMSLQNNVWSQPLNTSVVSRNLCKNVSEIFNETILNEYSYLKRLKLYHLPCNNDHHLRCFFDDYRMCICTRMHNSDCRLFSHDYGVCNYCQNDGLCLIQKPNQEQWKFHCLCRNCSFGSSCQFASGNYFITLDMLIGIEMKTGNTSFNQQSIVIYLTLIFLLIILLISLIFNTLSIFVFLNKKLSQVGCDFYLLNLTIVSQLGLILLFLRFIYMIIIQMYIVDNLLFIKISCISLEYLIRLIPSLFDWLTVCISIERAYTVIKDIHFTKVIALKTLKLSRWIILIVILLNILTTLHRPFYLKLVDEITLNDEPAGHPWCVLDFQSTSWNVYEKVINICHLVIPFILNVTSIIFFVSRKTQSELTSTVRKNKGTKFQIMKEQLLKYKPLLISTIIIIILEFPRFILTFTLSCIKHSWQRYVYLIGYLISFLPLTSVLFIYIIPSPKYKQQLKTIINKISCSTFFKTA